MAEISNDVRDRITEIIDRVKTDDRPLDTTEYAAAIEQIMADAILADRGRRDVDPTAIAQQVLDAHFIRPHWRRSGEQIAGSMEGTNSDVRDRLRNLHSPVDIEPSDTICSECSFQLPNGRYFGKVVEWPCPTLIAIGEGDR